MAPTVLVSIGGSSGLGFNALTKLLLTDSPQYKIILGSRAPLPATQQKQIDSLLKASNSTFERLEIDLISLKSVKAFCEKLKKDYPEPIDHLVLCAGMVPGTYSKTEDGNERALQVNALSHALIIEHLAPKLAANGRILFFGTSLHRKVLPRSLTPENVDASLQEQPFAPMQVYLKTKFVQMFLFALTHQRFAQDPRKLRVIIVSPGFVPDTGLVRELSLMKRLLMQNVAPRMMFVTTPDDAGLTIRRGIVQDIPSGTYYSKRKYENMAEEVYDPDLQQRWRQFLVSRGVWELNTPAA
ncbi:hypothetical protein FRC03_000478 [Tulasnella sp. 419]|nr:hypothetical protein FRC03_000478 [Tulasnella sp. 419]